MDKTLEQRVTELEAELKGAKAEAAKPKGFVPKQPFQRWDPTEGMGMPASAVKAMVDCVGDFRGIAAEQRTLATPGMLPATDAPAGPEERGSGWATPTPLGPPPGVRLCDQQMDVADAVDRRDLERRLKGGG